ncbi:MAG: type II toxin-antitoxin system VapC family toxin [Alphaproteobacteria bacterium]|nr:MAG: type II toxin-antitoxin system VapC family toxin [Alphaproteobacteria bacterium]
MVVDSSALIAILRGEPEGPAFRNAIRTAPNRLLSAPTRVKAGMVALGRRGEPGLEQMQALIERLELEVVPLSDDHGKLAIEAFRRFGKGRHPAGLNYCDCLSYALAKATGEPLLFKGDNFAHTDIRRAV